MKLLSRVRKMFFKPKCDHRWLPKGSPMDNEYFYYHEFRCPKCKEIKEILIQKSLSDTLK